VLITLQTGGIATKAGWFAKENSSKPGERETARKLTNHLAAALDLPTDKLRDGWQESLEDLYSELYSGTLFPDFAEQRDQQTGRALARREILREFAGKSFTVEDVKQHCMQETDCVLKEGDYRNLVLEMRRNGELERIGSGPIARDTKFKVASV